MKNLFRYFFPRKTKWMPLGVSTWDLSEQYIIYFRTNLENHIMEFKSVRVNRSFGKCVMSILDKQMLDPTEQWNKMQELLANIQ